MSVGCEVPSNCTAKSGMRSVSATTKSNVAFVTNCVSSSEIPVPSVRKMSCAFTRISTAAPSLLQVAESPKLTASS